MKRLKNISTMSPVRENRCGISISYKAKRISTGILVVPLIYGNALKNTLQVLYHQQKVVIRLILFIMKPVLTRMMLLREKNI